MSSLQFSFKPGARTINTFCVFMVVSNDTERLTANGRKKKKEKTRPTLGNCLAQKTPHRTFRVFQAKAFEKKKKKKKKKKDGRKEGRKVRKWKS